MSSDPATAAKAPLSPATRGALTRYRVIAYIVGVMLLLVFIAWPLKRLGDSPEMMNVVGPLHGFLYMVYLLATFDLGRRVGWTLKHMLFIALAGTVPFLSFYAERRTTRELVD